MNEAANRPPLSLPKAAIATLVYLYLVLGSVPALSLMIIGPAIGSSRDLLDAHFFAFVAIIGGWLLTILFVVRSGRIVGLYLFRGTAWLLAIMLALGSAVAVLLALGIVGDGSRDVRLTGQFAIAGFVVCLPLVWLMMRGLTRVRWLDPASSPLEWEPPVRRKGLSTKRRPADRRHH